MLSALSETVLEEDEILKQPNKSQQGWKQCGRFVEEALFSAAD